MTERTPCDRLRDARERIGLTQDQVATRVGLSEEWYCDLESYPGEIFSNVSLAHLQALGDVLNVEPQTLLLGTHSSASCDEVTFETLATKLREAMLSAGLDVERFSERVGWDLKDLLIDSQELWNFTVDGLRDVCEAAHVDWFAVLPGLWR